MANLYVVRHRDGKSSSPLSEDEIRKRIRSGEIKESDELSLYPNQFALGVKDYPEFEEEFKDNDKTTMRERPEGEIHDEKTNIIGNAAITERTQTSARRSPMPARRAPSPVARDEFSGSGLKKQQTTLIQRPKELLSKQEAEKKKKYTIPKKSFLILFLLLLVVYDVMFEEDEDAKAKPDVVLVPVRPQLPSGGVEKIDPETSVRIYNEGLKPYLEDTVQGYRRAADTFQVSLRFDPQNVKALAMLASSYLNLIDSSNKDENTFAVINKLIELSRLKQLDLVETLVSEIEFLAISNRTDAAIQRLVEYSKVTGKFDPLLYYYLGWLYSIKMEYANAMKYLNLIPASALPMPRLYYLRGYLHEQNREYDEATAEYKRALTLNPKHAKSILGLVRIAEAKGELKQVLRYVEFLTGNPSLQSPREFITSLIYRSKLALLYQQKDTAIRSLERAIRIDPKNEDLRLEYYTLLSSSDSKSKYKQLAQMYALVLDGERNRKAGKIHEAKTVLLQAQDAFPKSPVPFEKMGDLFYYSGEYDRAQQNYKKAIEIDSQAANVATKLIDSLIRNHEWEEAQNFLGRFRTHPKVRSAIDRLAGDLAYAQQNTVQAVTFYRKAMARDSIDTEVYSSYANLLRDMDQCRDAQFFYSLAHRLDPFNFSAVIGAGKCLLKTDGIEAAVGRIQEELARLPKARADLLVGIAQIYASAHDDDRALQFISQAREVDPDYPDGYRVAGEIYLRQMVSRKDTKEKALEAFKAYSDRKRSDPSGYIQRFEIFLKESNFEKGAEELNRVFEVSPRYPELHYRRAQMLMKMGKTKDALAELEEELKLNPRFVRGLVDQGNALIAAGNVEEAMKSFVKAMEVDPQSAPAKIGAGYTNYLKRQFPSAIALFQAALVLDKGNPDIYKKMGFAYRDSGDNQRAAQAFQSYLDLAPDAPDRADFEQYRR